MKKKRGRPKKKVQTAEDEDKSQGECRSKGRVIKQREEVEDCGGTG